MNSPSEVCTHENSNYIPYIQVYLVLLSLFLVYGLHSASLIPTSFTSIDNKLFGVLLFSDINVTFV
jgi:biopolymer transport protein ExbD